MVFIMYSLPRQDEETAVSVTVLLIIVICKWTPKGKIRQEKSNGNAAAGSSLQVHATNAYGYNESHQTSQPI